MLNFNITVKKNHNHDELKTLQQTMNKIPHLIKEIKQEHNSKAILETSESVEVLLDEFEFFSKAPCLANFDKILNKTWICSLKLGRETDMDIICNQKVKNFFQLIDTAINQLNNFANKHFR